MAKTDSEKSLYDATYSEIFFKNFLIGFARGLGGLFVQIVLLVVVYLGVVYFIVPKFQPIINFFERFGPQQTPTQQPSIFDQLFHPSKLDLDTPEQLQ